MKLCVDCHAIDLTIGKRRSRPEWITMIDKMISQGASVSDKDYDVILAYLSGNYGKTIRINEVSAADLKSLLDISDAEAAAIVKYRTEHGNFKTLADLEAVPGVNKVRISEEKLNFAFS